MAARMNDSDVQNEQGQSSLAADTKCPYYVAVENTIEQYYEIYDRLEEDNDRPSKKRKAVSEVTLSRKAVSEMRDTKSILFSDKRIGDLPGVGIGHQFISRGEMAAVGFHSQSSNLKEVDYGFKSDFEISIMSKEYNVDRFPIATSIVVLSREYNEEVAYISEMHEDYADRNRALRHNQEQQIPVRLIRKHPDEDKPVGKIYTYDGLYNVDESYLKEGVPRKLIYCLKRLDRKILTSKQARNYPFGDTNAIDGLCSEDISSEDPERIPIIATNVVDDATFPITNFTYSKSIVFDEKVRKPKTTCFCNCEHGCYDPKICSCAQPDGSYPYESEEDGRLQLPADDPVIYECGEDCPCGPRCRNKITQRGLQYRIEVFRTLNKGWAVRSWDQIPKGAYLSEYVGKISRLKDVESDHKNWYLFDIDQPDNGKRAKYCIDGSGIGNFVRFINHDCSPNLFVQRVLSGHREKNLARIVLFASEDIPAMTELTYDYGEAYCKELDCHCEKCKSSLM